MLELNQIVFVKSRLQVTVSIAVAFDYSVCFDAIFGIKFTILIVYRV